MPAVFSWINGEDQAVSKHHHQPSQPAATLESVTPEPAKAVEGQPAKLRWHVEIPMCLVAPGIVEAANEADALAAYMAANGILGTSQLPVVRRIASDAKPTAVPAVAAESPATE